MRLFSFSSLCLTAAPVALAALSALAVSAPKAHAQATVVFGGGSGAKLTATLAAPVSYTLTADIASNNFPAFVFQGANSPIKLTSFYFGSGTLSLPVFTLAAAH